MSPCKARLKIDVQGLGTCWALCVRWTPPLQESTAAGAREREAAAGDHAAARAGLEHQLWLLRDFAERRAEVEAGLRAAQDGVAAERAAGERRAMCAARHSAARLSAGRVCARGVSGDAGCGRRQACGRARCGRRMQPCAQQQLASCAASACPAPAKRTMSGAERLPGGAHSEVEREHAGDRERWHREGAARQAAAVAAAAAAAGANTADAVARRALLENEMLAAEVAYQSRQARRGRACAALPYPTLTLRAGGF